MAFKTPDQLIKQLVRGTPFGKTGYSDQARTRFDFGDYDSLADDEDIIDIPTNLSDAAKLYEATAPVNKARWKPKRPFINK